MKERDSLRKDDPQSPRLQEINKEIDKIINSHKRDKWKETIETKKNDTNKLYKLLKHLNGGARASTNEAIKFKGKYVSCSKKIADLINNTPQSQDILVAKQPGSTQETAKRINYHKKTTQKNRYKKQLRKRRHLKH